MSRAACFDALTFRTTRANCHAEHFMPPTGMLRKHDISFYRRSLSCRVLKPRAAHFDAMAFCTNCENCHPERGCNRSIIRASECAKGLVNEYHVLSGARLPHNRVRLP